HTWTRKLVFEHVHQHLLTTALKGRVIGIYLEIDDFTVVIKVKLKTFMHDVAHVFIDVFWRTRTGKIAMTVVQPHKRWCHMQYSVVTLFDMVIGKHHAAHKVTAITIA